jgi:hypothetical protein
MVSPIDLNGGTIKNGTDEDANLTYTPPQTNGILIDGVAPTISNVTSNKANGSYKAAQVIDVRVTFTEPVNIFGGTPQIELNVTGDDTRYAVYDAASTGALPASTLVFLYTVVANDESTDLDYAAVGSLDLSGATIQDAAGNDADTDLPAPAGTGSLGKNKNIVIDNTISIVNKVSSTLDNGTFRTDQTINIDVEFDEAVFISGVPRLKLNSNASAYATYIIGHGTNILKFRYKVLAGHESAGLNYSGANALEVNGGAGTISDAAGNQVVLATLLTAPAGGSLAANKDFIIDGIAPTVLAVTSADNGTYITGETITIEVQFSEDIVVEHNVGTTLPRIQLATNPYRYAEFDHEALSDADVMVFEYVIQAGDVNLGTYLDYRSIISLSLNGATIKDAAGNNAIRTLPPLGGGSSLSEAEIVIDAKAPTVRFVTSNKTNGSYTEGAIIDVRVTFTEPVNVAVDVPKIELNVTGDATRYAVYNADATGLLPATTLVFLYTVVANDVIPDLDYAAVGSLTLPGGATIQDAAGNDANTNLPAPGANGSLGRNKNIIIDTEAPAVSDVVSAYEEAGLDRTFLYRQFVYINVVFNERVFVSGAPRLKLDANAGADRYANFRSGHGTNTLRFSYLVDSDDESAGLDYTGVDALEVIGGTGTITDAAGNEVDLSTLLFVPGTEGSLSDYTDDHKIVITIDGSVPTITSVIATNASNTYNTGNITIEVTFSEDVTVAGGVPSIQLNTNPIRYANYVGTLANVLTFQYAIQLGDVSAQLDYPRITSLRLNGATIKDVAGNMAIRNLPTPNGMGKTIVIDAYAPTITSVTSNKLNGSYTVGEVIDVRVTFSEPVNVAVADPQIELNVTGDDPRYAVYNAAATGALPASTLVFLYTVEANDEAADLNYAAIGSLDTNGATITDVVGNTANPNLPNPIANGSLGKNKNIVIDTQAPLFDDVISAYEAGGGLDDLTYIKGQIININVSFDERVYVTGTPRLKLDVNGTVDRYAIYRSGHGTNTLRFSYKVDTGDESAALDYTDAAALEVIVGGLNAGTITDAAGNEVDLSTLLPAPGDAGSLSHDAGKIIITVDGIVPTISAVTSANTGLVNTGTITITVEFSEDIDVDDTNGTPSIQLATSPIKYAEYTGASGNELTFEYVIENEVVSLGAFLDYTSISSFRLNGAIISDLAGNRINRYLPNIGLGNSLSEAQIVIDSKAPIITNVTSSKINGSYKKDDVIDVRVTFSEPVNIATANPRIVLNVTGDATRYAVYNAAATGTLPATTIVFLYTVQENDVTSNLDYAAIGSLDLNGATIKDIAVNNATTTLPIPGERGSLGRNKSIAVDGIIPAVTNVTSPNPNTTYGVGSVIYIWVSFSEIVYVTGSPTLALNSGGTATYLSGTATNQLTFKYVVELGHSAGDLNYTAIDALTGTIMDKAGNLSPLTLPGLAAAGSLGTNKNIVINTAKSSEYGEDGDNNETVNNEMLSRLDFLLYPNPSNGAINLNVNGISNSDYSIEVIDITGRLVYSEYSVNTIQPQFKINTAPGIYFMRLRANDQVVTQRFIIQ